MKSKDYTHIFVYKDVSHNMDYVKDELYALCQYFNVILNIHLSYSLFMEIR